MSESSEELFVNWLKKKADSVKESNIYESKSWLLTASTLFPSNISMKMESYRLAKQSGMKQEACLYLTAMLEMPGNDSNTELQTELNILLQSVQSDSNTEQDRLNYEIFFSLQADKLCELLKRLAHNCKDAMNKCSILLLLVKKFPNLAREYGPLLITTLFEAELKESPNNIKNAYRKYFVSDALPLMMSDNPAGTDKKILLNWLDKAFQYYVVTSLQPHKEGMMSPTSSSTVQPPMIKAQAISRPWESLAELLCKAARHVKWNIEFNHFRSDESLLRHLQKLHGILASEHSKTMKRELVYIGAYLLFKLIHTYNTLSKASEPICLVQKSFSDKQATPRKKKKGAPAASRENAVLAAGDGVQNSDQLFHVFKTACTVWSMLHSDYSKSFNEFLDRLDYRQWKSSLANFTKDRIVFMQEYEDYPISSTLEASIYRLQRTCCQYALGMHKQSCLEIIDIVTDLTLSTHGGGCNCASSSSKAEETTNSQLEYLFISQPKDVFDCGITIIINALQESLKREPDNHDVIGNLCVLSQLSWPKHKTLFYQLVSKIKVCEKFSYPVFFDYIINTEIIEEFAFLKTEQGGEVVLEIHAASLQQRSKQRTVTRGVTRDVEVDMKASFEKQIARSSECVQRLVVKFLIEKKNEILAPLPK